MKHYFDITLLPDAELKAQVLMNAVFAKVHKMLCDMYSTTIGVSFPQCEMVCSINKSKLPPNMPQRYVSLGNILRVHGEESNLRQFLSNNWLGGMRGYCQVSNVMVVPGDVKYRNISRVQTTLKLSKLRRLQKRGTINQEETKNYKVKMSTKILDNPYLELTSGSNGNKYRRYIQFGAILDKPILGEFDQFGLSKVATVPWF